MSSTESLRKDHYLIEKMLKSLNITIELLQEGKKFRMRYYIKQLTS